LLNWEYLGRQLQIMALKFSCLHAFCAMVTQIKAELSKSC
jgi:hypothetical protein